MPLSPLQIDVLAKNYELARADATNAQKIVDNLRDRILEEAEQSGVTPARAIKSKALLGNRYELRVSYPAEVVVDTAAALRIRRACAMAGKPKLFRRLFKTVTTFTLVGGAHKTVAAQRFLRSLFGQALTVTEQAPKVEIRERKAASGAAA